MGDAKAVVARLEQALNAHDLEALADCFDEGVVSEQPVHPARAFCGRDQVEKNWRQIFSGFPDLAARVVRSTVDGRRGGGLGGMGLARTSRGRRER